MKDEASSSPWRNASVRISSDMEKRLKVAAKTAGVKPSELIRSAIHLSLPQLERNPDLVRRLDAGLEPEKELGNTGGLSVGTSDRAEIKKVSGWYQLQPEEVLHEAIELGLPAVVSRTAIRQARVVDGGRISPEEAEFWISSRPDADAYHKEFIRAASRERGLRQLLASVAAHPDGSKALQEIREQEQKLVNEGKFIPGLGINLNYQAANPPSSEPAIGKPVAETVSTPKPEKSKKKAK